MFTVNLFILLSFQIIVNAFFLESDVALSVGSEMEGSGDGYDFFDVEGDQDPVC